MDTLDGGVASQTTTQCHSSHQKGHRMKIYLIDSDEEAIVAFVKYHEKLYSKTYMIKNKARKEFQWERFTSSCNLKV